MVILFLAIACVALMISPRAAASAGHLCLAQAVYFEVRGEPNAGQFGVASVVLSRVAHPAYPDTICEVVFEASARRNGCQFSFACDSLSDRAAPGAAWQQSLHVAGQVLAGLRPDFTGRAAHYHALSVDPLSAKDLTHTVTIGQHRFYHDRSSKLINR